MYTIIKFSKVNNKWIEIMKFLNCSKELADYYINKNRFRGFTRYVMERSRKNEKKRK